MCHEDFATLYKSRYEKIKPIVVKDSGFLNWDRLGERAKKELSEFDADVVFIPTNNLHTRSYGNVLKIAKMTQSVENIYFINASGQLRPVQR